MKTSLLTVIARCLNIFAMVPATIRAKFARPALAPIRITNGCGMQDSSWRDTSRNGTSGY